MSRREVVGHCWALAEASRGPCEPGGCFTPFREELLALDRQPRAPRLFQLFPLLCSSAHKGTWEKRKEEKKAGLVSDGSLEVPVSCGSFCVLSGVAYCSFFLLYFFLLFFFKSKSI